MMNSDTTYTAQAVSTPSIFHLTGMEDVNPISQGDSSTNVSDISTITSIEQRMVNKHRPTPLTFPSSCLGTSELSNNMDTDYEEEDILTPKILQTSRSSSRDQVYDRPVFFISEVPNTQPSSLEMKNKIDKVITSGSAFLQLPTAIERRRHSWMSG